MEQGSGIPGYESGVQITLRNVLSGDACACVCRNNLPCHGGVAQDVVRTVFSPDFPS